MQWTSTIEVGSSVEVGTSEVITFGVSASCIDDFIGDRYCDEENNNPECDHDGGIKCF